MHRNGCRTAEMPSLPIFHLISLLPNYTVNLPNFPHFTLTSNLYLYYFFQYLCNHKFQSKVPQEATNWCLIKQFPGCAVVHAMQRPSRINLLSSNYFFWLIFCFFSVLTWRLWDCMLSMELRRHINEQVQWGRQ